MLTHLKPSHIINFLNQAKDTVDLLYGRKDSVSRSELLAYGKVSEIVLDRLIDYGLLHDQYGYLVLDNRIFTFLDDFLELGEVHPEFIESSLSDLKMFISYYRNDQKKAHLRSVKDALRRIKTTSNIEVIKLQKLIDDTYKNEGNYENKKRKLESYREKRDLIRDLIHQTEEFYALNKDLLLNSPDIELKNVAVDLRQSLRNNTDFLLEIQSQIIDYLNRIQYRNDLYKKIQRLKELKDTLEINHHTNYRDIIASDDSLTFNKEHRIRLKTKVSIPFLYSDEGAELVAKVADKVAWNRRYSKPKATAISDEAALEAPEQEVKIDVPHLYEKFQNSTLDLMYFLLNYAFPSTVGTISQERKIALYVEIALDYEDDLSFTSDYASLVVKRENGKSKRIEYCLIYSLKQES